MHQSKLFRPKRCLMCKEDISYKADVSLADPWLGKYKISDKIGHTMFLINTEKGLAFIEEMKNKSLANRFFCGRLYRSSRTYYNGQR